MSKAELVQWLDAVIEVHVELKTYATDKRKAIITNDMKELDAIVKGEQKCILSIRNLELKREILIHELFKNRYQFKKTIVLSDVLPLLSENEKNEVERKQQKLLNIIQSIKEQNEENNALLKQSLYYTNRMLGTLTPQKRMNIGTYGGNGKVDYKKQIGQFSSSI